MLKQLGIALIGLLLTSAALTLEPSGSTPYGQPGLEYVDVSDPLIISAANFAAREIQRGSLYRTIFAQIQNTDEGAIYVLTIEVVDAHFKHHRYNVQVFMPSESDQWKVIYFTPSSR